MIISLTAHDRPELLAQVAESIDVAAGNLKGESVLMTATIEPSGHEMAIHWALKSMRNVLVYPTINGSVLGLQTNTRKALNQAWDAAAKLQQDFVLHLEDDLLLAPDALSFAAWARDEYRDVEEVAFIGLTAVHGRPPREDWNRVRREEWFDCHAWGTWLRTWDKMIDTWPHEWRDFWARFVNDHRMFGGLQIIPCLSRSCSLGVHGTHSNEEHHQRHNPELYAGDVGVNFEDFFEDGVWRAAGVIEYEGPEVGRRRELCESSLT